jgi:DNA processing protein
MVGARNASAAACRFARQLAYDLGQQGVVVVSGLARGIDSAAHDGALDTGTIGVIAGGLDVFYPPANQGRQEVMAERGLVVAEMPPGIEPRARHFLAARSWQSRGRRSIRGPRGATSSSETARR